MKKISILDGNFGHHPDSVAQYQKSEHFEWDRTGEIVSNTAFITDNYLKLVNKCNAKRKVAWLLEPPAINPGMYDWISQKHKEFDFVLTYDKSLLNKGSNFLFYPYGTTWIRDPKMYIEKLKDISIIASDKQFTQGHLFRKECIDIVGKNNIDHFGRGYNEIRFKEEGLVDYKFSIVIENSKRDFYFSEKLVDCFLTKTIPIYWGCPSIENFFDSRGILQFNDTKELENIINDIKSGNIVYEKLTPCITINYSIAFDKYNIPENWIYENYKFLFK